MTDWDFYKEKLYSKIYFDLNKVWANVFPLSSESKNNFFEIHEDLIKELFDYMDPNYKKFIVKLLLKLQEVYNLPFANEKIIRERLNLDIKKINLNEDTKTNDNLLILENEKILSEKEKQLEMKKKSEWNLINNLEIEQQNLLQIKKQEKIISENKKVENSLKTQIASKQEEKILEKNKDLNFDNFNNKKNEELQMKEKESKNIKKKILTETSQKVYSEIQELQNKKLEESKLQKLKDREKLKEEEKEFLKYHGKSTKEVRDKLKKKSNENQNKNENDPEEVAYLKYYQTVYEPLRVTKSDYTNFIQEREKKKKIEKDEDLQYLNSYTSLLDSQERSRTQNQLKLVSKFEFKENNNSENISSIKKSINKETLKFVKNQIIEKTVFKQQERELEKSTEKIIASKVKKEIEEEKRKKREEELCKKLSYAKDLNEQVNAKKISSLTQEGMNEEEKLYNMELLAKARKTLTKKFLK